MHPNDLRYPAIYHDGHAYFLERSEMHTASYFGGPFAAPITGVRHGPRRLHHIATINGDCFEPLWHIVGGGGCLQLLYGMCYSGCDLKYRRSPDGVKILEMKPKSSDADWPYPDYPIYLPYFPLRLLRRVPFTLGQFSELSCQPFHEMAADVIILIPPSPVLGMSLWGPSGDSECAQIVFQCDIAGQDVTAYNQCG
jgi:hypothetical protein